MTEADRKALADRIKAWSEFFATPTAAGMTMTEIAASSGDDLSADLIAASDELRTAPGYRDGIEAAAKVCEERAAMPSPDGQVGYGAKVAEALAARIRALMPPAAEEMVERAIQDGLAAWDGAEVSISKNITAVVRAAVAAMRRT